MTLQEDNVSRKKKNTDTSTATVETTVTVAWLSARKQLPQLSLSMTAETKGLEV